MTILVCDFLLKMLLVRVSLSPLNFCAAEKIKLHSNENIFHLKYSFLQFDHQKIGNPVINIYYSIDSVHTFLC